MPIMKALRLLTFSALLLTTCLANDSGRASDPTGCSNATLKGSFGFLISGTRPSGPPPAPIESFIGTALTVFDGKGNFSQVDNIHGSASPLVLDRNGFGTYSLNKDCSGTMTIINPGAPVLQLRILVVDGGNEVRAAVMEPAPVIVTSNGRRVGRVR